MSSPASSISACVACAASTSLVCASCLKARFCSRACAAVAWAGHRAACADFSVLAALPDEALDPVLPAAPLASMEPAALAGAGSSEPAAFAGSGFSCAVCGSSNAAVCARCRLVGYCGAAHQRKDWPTHKAVCRKGEFGVLPVQTWEQRMLAEAYAAAPASLAATAALPPIPAWNMASDGVPPTKIMRVWRKAADEGHSSAQSLLGFCYETGTGVTQDYKTAAAWYTKAAAKGYANAQFNLGVLYANGTGVAHDFKVTAAWYAKAAAQDDAGAQFGLAVCYANGFGVAKDFKVAAAWYAKAAAQGYADAQFNLGLCYATGAGVAQDGKASAAWYAKAAAQGHVNAQFNLGAVYTNGTGVVQNLGTAAEWYAKAAAQGDSEAAVRRDFCLAVAAAAADASRG